MVSYGNFVDEDKGEDSPVIQKIERYKRKLLQAMFDQLDEDEKRGILFNLKVSNNIQKISNNMVNITLLNIEKMIENKRLSKNKD